MIKLFVIVCLLTLCSVNYCYSKTLKGYVAYTVETARKEAFDNVPIRLDISKYKKYLIDENYKENSKLTFSYKFKDKYLTRFSNNTYVITYKNNKSISFYYDCNGVLEFISFDVNKVYPIKTIRYDAKGQLESIAFNISKSEQYIFDANKKLDSHWVNQNGYDENGNLFGTRK